MNPRLSLLLVAVIALISHLGTGEAKAGNPVCFGVGKAAKGTPPSGHRCLSILDLDGDGDTDQITWRTVDAGQFVEERIDVRLNDGSGSLTPHVLTLPGGDMTQTEDVELIFPGGGVPFALLLRLVDQNTDAKGVEIRWLKDGKWHKGLERWLGSCIEGELQEDRCVECGVDPAVFTKQEIAHQGQGDRFRLQVRQARIDRVGSPRLCKLSEKSEMLKLQAGQWVAAGPPGPKLPPPPATGIEEWVVAGASGHCLGYSTVRSTFVCADTAWEPGVAQVTLTHHGDLLEDFGGEETWLEDNPDAVRSLLQRLLPALSADKLVAVHEVALEQGQCAGPAGRLTIEGQTIRFTSGAGQVLLPQLLPKAIPGVPQEARRCAFTLDGKAVAIQWYAEESEQGGGPEEEPWGRSAWIQTPLP